MDTTTITLRHANQAPLKLNAASAPKSGAPKLILTAPWPLTLRSFETLWPLLTANFDVLAVDLPGFGDSPEGLETMSPLAMADVLERLLAQHAPGGAHLIATDVGVPAALAYAARDPKQLLTLTLSDGPGTAAPILQPGLRRMVDSAFFRWLYALSPKAFVQIAAKEGYKRAKPSHLEEAISAHRRPGMLRNTLRYLAAYPEALPQIDKALSSLEVPTLLLWGDSDVFVPPENAELIAARIDNSRVVRLTGAGHFAHEDDPRGFADAVARFVEKQALNGSRRTRPTSSAK